MNTNIYWSLRGRYGEKKKKLSEMERKWLEDIIIDKQYNSFLSDFCNYDKAHDTRDRHGHGKRIPYIGWFWRHVPFSSAEEISIGNCGHFIGFMPNNKWDYPERYMTKEEAEKVIGIIDEAMRLDQQGGDVSEIQQQIFACLETIWDYMQTLEVK
jgi:hypothetical protein